MNIATKFIAVIGLSACAFTSAAQAELLQYQATGSSITGTLGGTAFSNASWTITATADPTAAVHYNQGDLSGNIWAPVWSISVTAYLTIVSAAGTLTADLSGWDIESRDYSIFGTPNASVNGFFASFSDGNTGVEQGSGAYVQNNASSNPSVYNDLLSPGTFAATSGGFDAITYATSAGTLDVTAAPGSAGTFTITQTASVPEPASIATLGVGLAMLATIGRRRRRNTRA